jgi:hypothetical protein
MGIPPLSAFASPGGEEGQLQVPAQTVPEPPSVQPTYPPGYYPYVARFVDLNDPGTVFLDIPGAAAPVYVIHADDGHPELYIGSGKGRAASFSASAITVPLLDGTKGRIKWVESWIGFPVVTYEGRSVFSLPMPSRADRFVMFVVRVLLLVFGIIPGYFMGLGLARWMATMIKRGDSKAKRRLLPLAIALSPFLVAALFVAALALAMPGAES